MSTLLVKREVDYGLDGWIQDDVEDTDLLVLEKITGTIAAIIRRVNGELKPTSILTRIYAQIVDGQIVYFTKRS
jgi:hypothetical protein